MFGDQPWSNMFGDQTFPEFDDVAKRVSNKPSNMLPAAILDAYDQKSSS